MALTYLLLALAVGMATPFCIDVDFEWSAFRQNHNKNYASVEEETERFFIFAENVKLIEWHNWRFHKDLTSYWLAINDFADLTNEEFLIKKGLDRFNATPSSLNDTTSCLTPYFLNDTSSCVTPSSLNATSNCVTPYFLNGTSSCVTPHFLNGTLSCVTPYFLNDTQCVTSAYFLNDTVCCDSPYFFNGTTQDYVDWREKGYIAPAHNEAGECVFKTPHGEAKVQGCMEVLPKGDEEALEAAVLTVGPVSVTIDASKPSFQFYGGGVYDEISCSSSVWQELDAVVHGFGTMDGNKYWLVENSWGSSWGDKGYIFMSRDKANQCGIASNPSYPVVEVHNLL